MQGQGYHDCGCAWKTAAKIVSSAMTDSKAKMEDSMIKRLLLNSRLARAPDEGDKGLEINDQKG